MAVAYGRKLSEEHELTKDKFQGVSMQALLGLTRGIDRVTKFFGLIAIWMVLLASLLSAANAFVRYGLNVFIDFGRDHPNFGKQIDWIARAYSDNSNGFLEAQWYMFAAMVLFGGAWTLKVNEHVRVDLVYGAISERTRTWIDLLGGIFFLVPMCVMMIAITWPWFVESWRIGEGSTNAGGLLRWPVKLILPVGFFLLLLQAISEIIKCYAALTSNFVREFAYEKPLQ
jgi:TRAP-type mannitol/chloroaromatic compound transport system permease small subunit